MAGILQEAGRNVHGSSNLVCTIGRIMEERRGRKGRGVGVQGTKEKRV